MIPRKHSSVYGLNGKTVRSVWWQWRDRIFRHRITEIAGS